jgi:Rps23 Pro-64 3,4-dihydroxylase Tpa1-like proline 4-hydroxylase
LPVHDPPTDVEVFHAFLPPALLAAQHEHALAQADRHEPAVVNEDGVTLVDRAMRAAEFCPAGLGELRGPFLDLVLAKLDAMLAALGMARFEVADIEAELVAHNDGAFFSRHIDTRLDYAEAGKDIHRMISLVYYFHREPKGFHGGELELHPVARGEPQVFEPLNNRLIAFPSFIPHEVRRVACPSGEFADSRFAINVWLSRTRKAA